MRNINTIKILPAALFFFFFGATTLYAANIQFELQQVNAKDVRGSFLVSTMLHPDGDVINAIQLEIEVQGAAYIEEVYDGDTIITNWIEKPHFDASSITFSGIVAGGFDGIAIPGVREKRPGKIFDFVVHPRDIGDITLRVKSAQVLLHDGKGSEIDVNSSPLNVFVSSVERDSAKDFFFDDVTPPELLTHNVVSGNELLSGTRLLMLDIRDSESGISYIEISENDGAYTRSDFVHSLQDGTNKIDIRMVDKAGNVAIDTIVFEKTLIQQVQNWNEAMLFILILFIIVAVALLRRLFCK